MRIYGVIALVLSGAVLVGAHPHFAKSTQVELPGGVQATISYTTVPANESRAVNAAVGSFVTPRGPQLNLSGEVQVGALSIPAGDYTIGVVKNGDDDWTMALSPGRVGRGEAPDPSQLIKLDSIYSSSQHTVDHLRVDIEPGHGRFEGKAVLVIEYGSMACAGALS